MNKMLQEVLRWHRPARRHTPAARWSGWTQALAERYGRVARRHGPPGMILSHPRSAILYCQRWEHIAWALSPRIALSINPLLAEIAWPGPRLAVPARDLPPALRAYAHQTARPAAGSSMPGIFGLGGSQQATMTLSRKSPTSPEDTAARIDEQLRQAIAAERSAGTWQAPLRRVFRRSEMSQEMEHAVGQVARAGVEVARRVIDERQRVETRAPATGVLQPRRDSVAVMAQAAAPAGFGPTVTSPSSGWHTSGAPVAPPALDIEHLTEQVVHQIDRRIVAHRERLGRPY